MNCISKRLVKHSVVYYKRRLSEYSSTKKFGIDDYYNLNISTNLLDVCRLPEALPSLFADDFCSFIILHDLNLQFGSHLSGSVHCESKTISILSLGKPSDDKHFFLLLQSILFPLKFSKLKSYVVAEIAICWALGTVIGFLPFVWHVQRPIEKCYYIDVVTDGLQFFRFVLVVIIPAFILFIIYIVIYKVAMKQVRNSSLKQESN